MRFLLFLFVVLLSANSHAGLGCELLQTKSATNLKPEFNRRLDTKVDDLYSKLTRGKFDLVEVFDQIEEKVLLSLPDANPLYVWEKVVHLNCLQLSNSKQNDVVKWDKYSQLLTLYTDHTPLVIANNSGSVEWEGSECE